MQYVHKIHIKNFFKFDTHIYLTSEPGNKYLPAGHSRNFNACIKAELRNRGTLEMSPVVLKTKERRR